MLITRVDKFFATKLQAASTKNTKDSPGKHLGVKRLGGEKVFPNDIIVRQRGLKWKPGHNTLIGRDHTIHSKKEGIIKFTKKYVRKRKVTTIHVIPQIHENKKVRPAPPYCYHPELYPELSLKNPEPTNYTIHKKPEPKPRTLRHDYPVKSHILASMFSIKLPFESAQKSTLLADQSIKKTIPKSDPELEANMLSYQTSSRFDSINIHLGKIRNIELLGRIKEALPSVSSIEADSMRLSEENEKLLDDFFERNQNDYSENKGEISSDIVVQEFIEILMKISGEKEESAQDKEDLAPRVKKILLDWKISGAEKNPENEAYRRMIAKLKEIAQIRAFHASIRHGIVEPEKTRKYFKPKSKNPYIREKTTNV